MLAAHYISWLPLEVSFLPFATAVIFTKRLHRFIYLCAYLVPNTLLVALGSYEIGVPLVLIALFCISGLVLNLIIGTYLGVLTFGLIYFLAGVFPMGPLSLVVYIPQLLGITPIILLFILAISLGLFSQAQHRAFIIVGGLIGLTVLQITSEEQYPIPQSKASFQKVALKDQNRPGKLPALIEIDALLAKNNVVILGENVIHHTNTRALDFLCGSVRRYGSDLFIGIEQDDGAGNMVHVSASTCPGSDTIYEPESVVPGVNGSWTDIKFLDHRPLRLAESDVSIFWLACYEAAATRRWTSIARGAKNAPANSAIIVYTNTAWAKWFPADQIMSKVIGLHRKFTNLPVYEVNARTSALVVPKNV